MNTDRDAVHEYLEIQPKIAGNVLEHLREALYLDKDEETDSYSFRLEVLADHLRLERIQSQTYEQQFEEDIEPVVEWKASELANGLVNLARSPLRTLKGEESEPIYSAAVTLSEQVLESDATLPEIVSAQTSLSLLAVDIVDIDRMAAVVESRTEEVDDAIPG